MHQIVQSTGKKRFGNDTPYRQIQQDALLLIESYGVAVSSHTSRKLISAMPSDEVSHVNYRRFMRKTGHPMTSFMDITAMMMVGLIVASGFALVASKITSR
jgi:hypothetical protein